METNPFLTYELLTPETADPVIIRITGQRERWFPDFKASNGVEIKSHWFPSYGRIPAYDAPTRRCLCVRGKWENVLWESLGVEIPLADWPAVKDAITELNEHYKEKDMKEDRYEFDLSAWQYTTEPEPFEFPAPTKLIVTRKKPKVKVEWRAKDLNSALGRNETAHFEDYGCYRIVQFRVTGWDGDCASVEYFDKGRLRSLLKNTDTTFHNIFDSEGLYIGRDAIGKWSAPVLLPEAVYNKLPEIVKALEEKANEVKG